MPISDSTTIGTSSCFVASGRIGSANRTKPYVPIFRSTAARMIEPAVGASTCASGSQVWNGNIGTLMAKPKKKPRKIQNCSVGGMRCPISWNCSTLNVGLVAQARDVEERDAAVVEEEQRQDRQQHQHRSGQRVEEELDRGVELPRAAPDADDEVHRHEHDFPEDVEEEEVERAERADHAGLQHEQQRVVLLLAVMDGAVRRDHGDDAR